MEKIEHISRLFSLTGQPQQQPVPCFCSMKFRKATKPEALAKEIHKFIKDKIQPSTNLQNDSYYVVVYCCSELKDLHASLLPPGTVVVPYKSVKTLLCPFGLNQLILIAEEKANSGKKMNVLTSVTGNK
jgi:hypothetical protein